jgi:NTP pyrophosphatase (non-canonical NTP hydrolase)
VAYSGAVVALELADQATTVWIDSLEDPTDAQRANLAEEFADVLAWLTTMANVAGVDLEAALTKYTQAGRVEGVKD